MPLPAAVIAALVGPAMKAGTAAYQGIRAKQLRDKYPRPTYQIPGEVGELAQASRLAYNDPNLYGRNIAARQLDAAAAAGAGRAMDTGRGSNEVLATIAALNANKNQSLENLAVEGERARNQRYFQMSRALNNMADYRDQAYNENLKEPYTNAQQAAGALAGASIQNLYGATEDFSDIATKMLPTSGLGNNNKGTISAIGSKLSNNDLDRLVQSLAARRYAGGGITQGLLGVGEGIKGIRRDVLNGIGY